MLSLAAVTSAGPLAQDHQHPGGRIGTVHFQTSCTAAAQTQFDRTMAWLHSFEFGAAIEGFTATAKTDPGCAMAYWGLAIARWTNPFAATIRQPAQLQAGLDAVREAERIGAKTERERAYVAAVAKLYVDGATSDQRTRVLAYERAMADLAAKYPDDREASIFWALSLAISALPTDKTYANQLKAGAILEKLYPAATGSSRHHPLHHSQLRRSGAGRQGDRGRAPVRGHRAGRAARAPHALAHVHARRRLAGIDRLEQGVRRSRAQSVNAKAEQLHAMDYMTYAYLQTAQDRAVAALLETLPGIAATFDPSAVTGAAPGSAGIFALATMPARWALERRDWAAAAAIAAPNRTTVPYADAITHFARALGAARTNRLDDARASIAALREIGDRLAQAKEAYWAEQIAIQHDGANAFLLLAEGKRDEAVAAMRAAAVREDATDKNAVTPGPIAPARELLGEMLLELKQPAAALKEFQTTLKKEPNRFRAVYGAAVSAELSGDRATSRSYYEQLVKLCARADQPERPELRTAKQKLGR